MSVSRLWYCSMVMWVLPLGKLGEGYTRPLCTVFCNFLQVYNYFQIKSLKKCLPRWSSPVDNPLMTTAAWLSHSRRQISTGGKWAYVSVTSINWPQTNAHYVFRWQLSLIFLVPPSHWDLSSCVFTCSLKGPTARPWWTPLVLDSSDPASNSSTVQMNIPFSIILQLSRECKLFEMGSPSVVCTLYPHHLGYCPTHRSDSENIYWWATD